jgi:hypothetical protein
MSIALPNRLCRPMSLPHSERISGHFRPRMSVADALNDSRATRSPPDDEIRERLSLFPKFSGLFSLETCEEGELGDCSLRMQNTESSGIARVRRLPYTVFPAAPRAGKGRFPQRLAAPCHRLASSNLLVQDFLGSRTYFCLAGGRGPDGDATGSTPCCSTKANQERQGIHLAQGRSQPAGQSAQWPPESFSSFD